MKKSLQFLFLICSNTFFAQQNTVSSGGNATNIDGNASYTVGLVAYQFSSGSNGNASTGVQHTFEAILALPDLFPNLQIAVFPNPAVTSVTLQVDADGIQENMTYSIIDSNGKIISIAKITSNQTTINVEQLTNAIYFLTVNQNNQPLKTFKLIKRT
jgi:hypothetical protein